MEKQIDDGGPAFATSTTFSFVGECAYGQPGMSLRAWLAGQALNGMLANCDGERSRRQVVDDSLIYADMIIDALNRAQMVHDEDTKKS